MNKKSTKNIVILSITLALIIILQAFSSLLQKLGLPMSLALGLIPVLVISQTHGIKFGAISGFFFGLITLLFSVIYMSAVPMYKVTANPLVSVLPRIMSGTICALSYSGFLQIWFKHNSNPPRRKRRIAMIAISAVSTVLGVITNTVLFLGMFFAFAHGRTFDNLVIDFKWILTSIVTINTVIEIAVFVVTVPSIVFAMTESKLAAKIYGNCSNKFDMKTTSDELKEPNCTNNQALYTENIKTVDGNNDGIKSKNTDNSN